MLVIICHYKTQPKEPEALILLSSAKNKAKNFMNLIFLCFFSVDTFAFCAYIEEKCSGHPFGNLRKPLVSTHERTFDLGEPQEDKQQQRQKTTDSKK